MCMVCSDPKQCPQVCPDCKGSKVYQPLIGPAVPCTLCKGEGCLCPMPGPSGNVSHTPPPDDPIIVDSGYGDCNFVQIAHAIESRLVEALAERYRIYEVKGMSLVQVPEGYRGVIGRIHATIHGCDPRSCSAAIDRIVDSVSLNCWRVSCCGDVKEQFFLGDVKVRENPKLNLFDVTINTVIHWQRNSPRVSQGL